MKKAPLILMSEALFPEENRTVETALHLVGQILFARATEALAQGTVRVDFLLAHKTVVRARNGIQATTATLDGLALHDDAKRHSDDNQSEQNKGKKEGFHGSVSDL